MTTAQLHAFRNHDFTGQTGKVLDIIIATPGLNANQIAERMPKIVEGGKKKDFPPGRVTARINGILSSGRLIVAGDKKNTTYYYEPNPDKWPEIAGRIQRIADLERITRFANRYKTRMDATTLEGLRRLYIGIESPSQ